MSTLEQARAVLPAWIGWAGPVVYVVLAGLASALAAWLGTSLALVGIQRVSGAHWSVRARLGFPARSVSALCLIALPVFFSIFTHLWTGPLTRVPWWMLTTATALTCLVPSHQEGGDRLEGVEGGGAADALQRAIRHLLQALQAHGQVRLALEAGGDEVRQHRARAHLDEGACAPAVHRLDLLREPHGPSDLLREPGADLVRRLRIGCGLRVRVHRPVGARQLDFVQERPERHGRRLDQRRVKRGGDRQPTCRDPTFLQAGGERFHCGAVELGILGFLVV